MLVHVHVHVHDDVNIKAEAGKLLVSKLFLPRPHHKGLENKAAVDGSGGNGGV